MNWAIRIRPTGPARLSQIPVLPSSFIQASREPALGVPPPSTILGILGAALGIRLGKDLARRDPLLGLSLVTQELESRGLRPIIGGSLLLGPIVLVEGTPAIPVYSKGATRFIKTESVERVLAEEKLKEEDIVAVAKLISSVGVGLGDYGPADYHAKRVVPGQTFRRSYVYLVRPDTGDPVNYEYLILVKTNREPPIMNSYVRMGGRTRIARVSVEEASNELQRLIGLAATPCTGEAASGKYLTITPWPFIPSEDTLYLEGPLDPKPKKIIGVPGIHAPKPRVTTLGLGFSEVAGIRRPLLPTIPPGTIIELDESTACPPLALGLEKAGYYQLLRD